MCKICRNEYEGLNHLRCDNCPLLTTIPNIQGLEVLYCDNCPLLTNISNIEGLKHLSCYNCPLVTTISHIERLWHLSCYGCPNIMYTSIALRVVNDIELLSKPYKDCKYLTSKKMNRLYNNIYNLWTKYRIKKYSIIKYKLNEDTMIKIIEFIIKK